MARKLRLASESAACVWIPLFALRCEEARRPGLAARPCAVLAPDDARRLWQVSPAARRAGVRPGMTVSQAIGLCPPLTLCEADPVHYDERFARLLLGLNAVSPVLEPAELGRVFVGTDGLERLYGGVEQIVAAIKQAVERYGGTAVGDVSEANYRLTALPPYRLGWGRGKFVAWVAACCAKPQQVIVVRPGAEREFLSLRPLAVLPLDVDTHRRLRQLGLRRLGDLTALPEEAVVAQFGREGRRLWRLAAGATTDPVIGRETPEPIVATLDFFTPVAGQDLLERALERLVERALKHPRRTGWRVHVARVSAALEHGASWLAEATLKDPTADRDRVAAPFKTRLAQAPPAGAVERLTVEFTAFVPGTAELQLFARDVSAAARAGRRRALRAAVQEIRLRLKRPMLYHVVEVQPWSRIPERRYALIDYEP